MSRAAIALLVLFCPGLSSAEDAVPDATGSIRGRILFDGEVPKLSPLVERGGKQNGAVVKDALCFVQGVSDESLVIDPKTRGAANIFVYLRHRPDGLPEKLGIPPKQSVRVTMTGGRFQPRAALVRTSQPVVCSHTDPCVYNAHPFPIANNVPGFLLPPDGKVPPFTFGRPEILPIQVKCDIHAWMTGYWLILDHPYAAVTDDEGRFEINGLPPGKHSFRVWHERAGYLEKSLEVDVEADRTTVVPTRSYPATEFE